MDTRSAKQLIKITFKYPFREVDGMLYIKLDVRFVAPPHLHSNNA